MKKYLSYLLAMILGAAIITLVVTANNKKQRVPDQRITLRKSDKIPYGTYIAYENLQYVFPDATIYSSNEEPGYWDSLSSFESGQLYMVLNTEFDADDMEYMKLMKFAQNGNDVFLIVQSLSQIVQTKLGCMVAAYDLDYTSPYELADSMRISLGSPPYPPRSTYIYPGKTFNSYFSSVNENTTRILGHDSEGHSNFIHLKTGRGNLFIHLEPLAFSNYFLLHKQNISYYEKAMSVVSPGIRKIVWDDYYREKAQYKRPEKKKGWFSVFMSYPSLRAGLLTAIFALLIYVLLEMRRKQRSIPVLAKPKNDSLDFVKTIGRLYFDKGDHRNLTRKMGAYFLEFVRNKYKLATGNLDDDFIKAVQHKSGAGEEEVKRIVGFIRISEQSGSVSPAQVTSFYRLLESFYNTAR